MLSIPDDMQNRMWIAVFLNLFAASHELTTF